MSIITYVDGCCLDYYGILPLQLLPHSLPLSHTPSLSPSHPHSSLPPSLSPPSSLPLPPSPGKEAVGWLVSWSFASSRSEGVTLASSMLRHGFFHPIKIQEGKGINVVKDPLLNKEFVDSEYAFYVFVSHVTACDLM